MRITVKRMICASTFIAAIVASGAVIAADHDEAATISANDAAGDIGDLYAFHADGRLTLILTFDGYRLRSETASYDADVLYCIHIDTDADNQPDHEIWARFGQNGAGEWGLQVEGIPGVDGALVTPVEEPLLDESSGAQVFAGLRDDPFFFDREGYLDTLMTGDLSFNPARDFVAIKNTSAIAVEFDHAALGGDAIAVWATTGRL